jgi:hypothetical protein
VRFCTQYIDLAGGSGAPILVVGTSRSGTTWIGGVISRMIRARSIFEPFILDSEEEIALPHGRRLDWAWFEKDRVLHVDPTLGMASRYYRGIRNILAGRVQSEWTDAEVKRSIYFRRVIKDIRANLLLPYIITIWPQLKVVWVVRNPVEVINSQIAMASRHGWAFDTEYQVVREGAGAGRWLLESLAAMEAAGSVVEKLAHKWCIETALPLRAAVHRHPTVALVSYDALVSDAAAWRSISQLVAGAAWSGPVFESLLESPSRTSRARVEGMNGRSAAIDVLAADDIRRIDGIISRYDVADLLAETHLAGTVLGMARESVPKMLTDASKPPPP